MHNRRLWTSKQTFCFLVHFFVVRLAAWFVVTRDSFFVSSFHACIWNYLKETLPSLNDPCVWSCEAWGPLTLSQDESLLKPPEHIKTFCIDMNLIVKIVIEPKLLTWVESHFGWGGSCSGWFNCWLYFCGQPVMFLRESEGNLLLSSKQYEASMWFLIHCTVHLFTTSNRCGKNLMVPGNRTSWPSIFVSSISYSFKVP